MHSQFNFFKNRVIFERKKKEESAFEDQDLNIFVIFQEQSICIFILLYILADQNIPSFPLNAF